jgi:hypothetical protein
MLLKQYHDDNKDDAAEFAFPDHAFWTLTCKHHAFALSEFDSALTTIDLKRFLSTSFIITKLLIEGTSTQV